MLLLRCAARSAVITIILIATGVFITPVFGEEMQSNTWMIEQDSINFGGGYAAGANYISEDTLGEVATGWSYADDYSLHAGYQQMDTETYIALTIDSSTVMTPSFTGLSGGIANGSMASVIKTNNDSGYSLQLSASTSPAMVKEDLSASFANYTVAGSSPDFTWLINNSDSEFGFTPEGADLVQDYLDNGSNTCNVSGGVDTADACWDKIDQLAKTLSRSAAADESGATTTIKVRAQSGFGHVQVSGTYHAALTVTAHVN